MSLKNQNVEKDAAIGSLIREARKSRGLSQMKLAEAIGVTFQQVQKYEKGSNRVALSTFLLICERLNFSPTELVGSVAETCEADTLLSAKVRECDRLKKQLDGIRALAMPRQHGGKEIEPTATGGQDGTE